MNSILKYIKAMVGILLILGVLIVTVVLAVLANRKEPPAPLTAAAEKRDLLQTVGAVGEIRCAVEEPVLFPLAYTVGTVSVKNGDTVEKGDLLFCYDTKKLDEDIAECQQMLQKLEDTETQSEKDSAEQTQRMNAFLRSAADAADIQYQNALAALSDANAAYRTGKAEYEAYLAEQNDAGDPAAEEKARVLLNRCERYEMFLADAEAQAERWKEQKDQAENTIRRASDKAQYQAELLKFTESASAHYRTELTQLRNMRTQTEVRAPRSGVITEVLSISGESGRQYTPAVKIGSMDDFAAVLNVSAETRANLKTGMEVLVTPGTAPEQFMKGVVSEIRLNSHSEYQTVVAVDHASSELLRNGTVCSGRFVLERADQTLCVPYDAVCTDADGEYVWRMDADQPVKQPVKTGLHCGYYTEIIADGALHEHDTVLLNPAEFFGEDAL